MKSVWILTCEYNDYDQYGEYFLDVFDSLPSTDELLINDIPTTQLKHVLAGGGRKDGEDQWWYLRERIFE